MSEEPIAHIGTSAQVNLDGAVETPAADAPQPTFPLVRDPALLLVKGKNGENKQYIKSLAHAVVTVVGKYGYANLKCVGASAVNNAMKAFTIASGDAKTHGLNLVVSSGFQSATFDEVEKTAMMLKVFDR
jgi:stage V sporulation protein SpoVS